MTAATIGEFCRCDVFAPEHAGVKVVAASVGIDLLGDDGQPFHCGALMEVRGGFIGPDWAKCTTCGLTIANGLSPHINCGYVLSDDVFDAHPEGAWSVIEEPAG